MRTKWKCLFALAVLANASLAYGGVSQAIEIDSMPLSIARDEFLKLRPGAREFGLGREHYDYMYLAPPKATAFGRPVGTFGRGFVGEAGCAAAIGFTGSSAAETKALVARISASFPVKKGEHTYPENQGTILYLENDDTFAAITKHPVKDSENLNVVHVVSLKSCSMKVKRGRWQTRPQ